jgi:sulfur carrier protein
VITIQLNGDNQHISASQSLTQTLAELRELPENFAIAVNEDFVPRGEYDNLQINEGDRIELLVPMQGG